MIRTVLIDLDDTLLINSMDRFLPAYFQRLGNYLADIVEPDRMLPALMNGTRAMLANQDPTVKLERKFADLYYPELDLDEDTLGGRIHHFYSEIFPELRPLTEPYPGAREFIEYLFANDYEVVIATNPLFPRLAIEARLEWAQIPVHEFDYTLVTSYEEFHFTKPHLAYFTEILGLIGRSITEAVMIGNDVSADLEPARKLGVPVFHLHADPVPEYPGGDFQAAQRWLEATGFDSNPGAIHTPDVNLARLRGYLAALLTLADKCPRDGWAERPEPGEWAPVEILAHLADVEEEVNLPRIRSFMEEEKPHLTAFNTDIWAEQRAYISYDPELTLERFTRDRVQLIAQLQGLDHASWEQKGIHSLLGPTTLAEVMHFVADHDLLHLGQMRNTIGFPQ
jgi:FMN phosphatase YigB (HAD superfamily)